MLFEMILTPFQAYSACNLLQCLWERFHMSLLYTGRILWILTPRHIPDKHLIARLYGREPSINTTCHRTKQEQMHWHKRTLIRIGFLFWGPYALQETTENSYYQTFDEINVQWMKEHYLDGNLGLITFKAKILNTAIAPHISIYLYLQRNCLVVIPSVRQARKVYWASI